MKNVALKYLSLSFIFYFSPMGLADDSTQMSLKEAAGKSPFLTLTAEHLAESKSPIHPFENSALPKPENYKGSFFELNHNYPSVLPPRAKQYPWEKVTQKGLITQQNAMQYVQAIKDYVADDMRKILFDKSAGNNKNWYQSIWLGTEREPIHGAYVGSGFPAGTLTEQTLDLTTYVYVLYDKRAATTLGNIWGRDKQSAMSPTITKESTQYAEGSVIVKYAFVTACGADWAPMDNAAVWQIYAPVNVNNGSATAQSKCKNNGSKGDTSTPVLTNLYLMQFDLIVKDSVASPDTGWVFATLVYDKGAKGKDAWDKMIPLGATWGGNPNVVNLKPEALTPPVTVNPALTENWINLKSPTYARSTLGWDGRLSGPNDGAVVTPAWTGGKYYHKGIASTGCLACHSSAQYPMTSFLLPTSTYPPQTLAPPLSGDANAAPLVLSEPGGSLWMERFQSHSGTTALGPQTSDGKMPVALDYDMVTAFKAIPMWQAAMKANQP
tara:strand:+ start:3433 stop:4917 length:1485 start_codon:yes stop_codon:yes gene_type:complete